MFELQTDTDQPQRAILVSSVVEWDDTERVQTSVFPITGHLLIATGCSTIKPRTKLPSVSRFRTHPNPIIHSYTLTVDSASKPVTTARKFSDETVGFFKEKPHVRSQWHGCGKRLLLKSPLRSSYETIEKTVRCSGTVSQLFRSGMTQEQPRTTSAINRTSPTRSDTNRISRCSKYRLSSPKKQS